MDEARQALGKPGGGSSGEQLLSGRDMVPARKRLDPTDLSGNRIDLRLEDHHDLPVRDHRSQKIVAPKAVRLSGRAAILHSLIRFYAIPMHEHWLDPLRVRRNRPDRPRTTTGQWRALSKCLCFYSEGAASER